MQNCMGILGTGLRCTKQANAPSIPEAAHLHHCRVHQRVYLRHVRDTGLHHQQGACLHYLTTHRWCARAPAEGHQVCEHHRQRNAQAIVGRNNEINRNAQVRDALEVYNNTVPLMPWHRVIQHLFAANHFGEGVRYDIAVRFFRHHNDRVVMFQVFVEYWHWVALGQRGPEPDPNRVNVAPPVPVPAGLGRIANDRQNVHTRVVSEQTNKGLEKLLEKEEAVGRPLRAPDWFAAKWLVKAYGPWTNVSRTVNDMHHWYTTISCRTPLDRLYRRQLDGLYHMIRDIKDEDTRQELYKRTFEECYESIGMCCDGHISRLCNVLIGFDEDFAPSVPFGEILQNKMAAIYALEIETAEKIRQANEFFNEFGVPEEERAPWLEAF